LAITRFQRVRRSGERHLAQPGLHPGRCLLQHERRHVVVDPLGEVLHQLLAPEVFEERGVEAARVVGAPGHAWRHRPEQCRTLDPCPPVARQVAHDLVAAHRVADQRHARQVECFDHGGDVRCQRVEVVAPAGIARAAVPAAVEGDHAHTVLAQREHLVVP
jgi:hypothetical protein